jgi:hypothetical protein
MVLLIWNFNVGFNRTSSPIWQRAFVDAARIPSRSSTLMAVQANFEAIVAVDSDPSWVSAVKTHPEFSEAIAQGRASVIHGNIGSTREWGNPKDGSDVRLWPNYIASAWREWARRACLPDLVYIDGRFRVACAYSVVVACGGSEASNRPVVLMHDFSEARPSYGDVLKFFDIEQRENSLVVLKIRADASSLEAMADLLGRQFDYG